MDYIRSVLPKTTLMSSANRIADPATFFTIAYNAWHRGSFSELICGAIASFVNSLFLFGATWMMIFHIDWDAVGSCQLNSGCTNAEFVTSGISLRSFSIFGAIIAISFVAGCIINVLFATKHLIETHYHTREVKQIVQDLVLIEEHATPIHEFMSGLSGKLDKVAEAVKKVKNPIPTRDLGAQDGGVHMSLHNEDDGDDNENQHNNNDTTSMNEDNNDNENSRLFPQNNKTTKKKASSSEQDNNNNNNTNDTSAVVNIPSSQQQQKRQALEDISWSEFSHLLVKRCKKLIVHGDSFDELRLVQTIMLQDNYIIALHASNLLNGRSLRWVDEQLIREILKLHFLDRRAINSGPAHEKVAETVTRWLWISVIFYPVVVSFFVIKALVRHAAEVRSQSVRLTTDAFTPEARWRTRLFNELPFVYENRLSLARKHLDNVTSSSHAASSQLLRIPHRISGIIITAILVVSLFSAEAAALGKFWGLSGAFWFSIAIMIYRWTEGRASQAGSDDTTAGTGDQAAESGSASTATRSKSVLQLMRPVADFLLYEDVEWNIDKSTPRRCLDSLKNYYVVSRVMNAANKIMFVMAAPFFLYRLSSAKSDELWPISEFVEKHSAFVNGIGSVCTFSIVPSENASHGGGGDDEYDEMNNNNNGAGVNLSGRTTMPIQRDPLDSYFGIGNTTITSLPNNNSRKSNNNNKNNQNQNQFSPPNQEMEEKPKTSSETSAAAVATEQTVEFSKEDFRRCRIINASAYDPYVEDTSLIHKRDVSLVAFGSAHRHWTDSMKRNASNPSHVALVSEQIQVQSSFMSTLMPPVEPLWEHFKTNHSVQMIISNRNNNLNATGGTVFEDTSIASAISDAQFIATIKTSTTPESYVELFARLREYAEFDFLRLILDTRSEELLKASIAVKK